MGNVKQSPKSWGWLSEDSTIGREWRERLSRIAIFECGWSEELKRIPENRILRVDSPVSAMPLWAFKSVHWIVDRTADFFRDPGRPSAIHFRLFRSIWNSQITPFHKSNRRMFSFFSLFLCVTDLSGDELQSRLERDDRHRNPSLEDRRQEKN
jgi:hypothetical protein